MRRIAACVLVMAALNASTAYAGLPPAGAAGAADVLQRLFPGMAAKQPGAKRAAVAPPAKAATVRAASASAAKQSPAAKPQPAAGPAAAAKPGKAAKPVVAPVLTSSAGAVALMPGLKPIKGPQSQEAQMSALFSMLQTPEEVVKNSELVTVPNDLQAKLARLAGAAMNGTKIVLPPDVQAELAKYLKQAGSHGHNILVPAGQTGMVFSKEIQDLVRASSG